MNEVKKPKRPLIFYYSIVLLVIMLINIFVMPEIAQHQIKEVDYNTFWKMVESGDIGQVEIQDNRILFTSKDEKKIYKTGKVGDDNDLRNSLIEKNINFRGEIIEETSPIMSFIISWVLPIAIFAALGQFLTRQMMKKAGGGNSMMFNMGKSNAKVYVKSSNGIKFSDVAGEDEAKENLTEIVNYLHDPKQYEEIGASMPKGILLVGPPGTGKTMKCSSVWARQRCVTCSARQRKKPPVSSS